MCKYLDRFIIIVPLVDISISLTLFSSAILKRRQANASPCLKTTLGCYYR
jgi:hypothetical protein